ncbi:MAG: hypothetical protein HZB46_03655 [Solirubrobacterales bacterium]|nr:hypothetical protein [Solirubrobacterales bacterium]
MRSTRLAPALVLVAALALLGATVAWAVTRGDDGHMRGYDRGAGWMMGYAPGGAAEPVDGIGEARAKASAFARRLGLRADEVLRFERNYYVTLVDRSGRDATEVLVDPESGVVSLEYGPAMMWNTRYGMAGGRTRGMMDGARMMGSYGRGMMGAGGGMMGQGTMMGTAAADPAAGGGGPVDQAGARSLAQRLVGARGDGVRVADRGEAFPGYFTFETLREGKIEGMISVNASTGAVWRHWWHGDFVGEA